MAFQNEKDHVPMGGGNSPDTIGEMFAAQQPGSRGDLESRFEDIVKISVSRFAIHLMLSDNGCRCRPRSSAPYEKTSNILQTVNR